MQKIAKKISKVAAILPHGSGLGAAAFADDQARLYAFRHRAVALRIKQLGNEDPPGKCRVLINCRQGRRDEAAGWDVIISHDGDVFGHIAASAVQRPDRADRDQGNKGRAAAEACLAMLDLRRRFETP